MYKHSFSILSGIPLIVVAFLLIAMSCNPNSNQAVEKLDSEEQSKLVTYDSLAAKKYGADDYGMRKYVIAFLKKGPNRDQDEETAKALQAAHMKNIRRMAKEGTLVLAGPFFDDGDLRGIYIFDVQSIEAAEALTNTDPAIKAGSLAMELKEWYGSAALMAVNEIHKAVTKKSW